jgi:putative flippase GtrA
VRIVRYFAVGATAAAVDLSLFALFAAHLGFNYLVVGCVTFLLATAVNYLLSVRFVFRSGVRFARRHEVLLVFAVSAVGLALHQLVLYAGVGLLHVHLLLAKVVATGTVFLWNYGARSRFVFPRLALTRLAARAAPVRSQAARPAPVRRPTGASIACGVQLRQSRRRGTPPRGKPAGDPGAGVPSAVTVRASGS